MDRLRRGTAIAFCHAKIAEGAKNGNSFFGILIEGDGWDFFVGGCGRQTPAIFRLSMKCQSKGLTPFFLWSLRDRSSHVVYPWDWTKSASIFEERKEPKNSFMESGFTQ